MPRTAIASPRFVVRDFGTCLRFASVGDIVAMPDNMIRGSVVLTTSMWFKTNLNGSLIGYQNTTYNSPPASFMAAIYIGSDYKLRGAYYQGSQTKITSTNTVNDGKWHHVALVGNTTTQSMYLDGALVDNLAGTINHFTGSKNQLGVGRTDSATWPSVPSGVTWFQYSGLIDDVRIYYSALSATDISNLYYGTEPSQSKTMWYKLDEGSGSSTTDSSGNSNTGTITGATYSTDVKFKPRTVNAAARTLITPRSFVS